MVVTYLTLFRILWFLDQTVGSRLGRDEKSILNFGSRNLEYREYVEDRGLDGRIIL
jgi:hypothetical protein